jgi:hypothetical protein
VISFALTTPDKAPPEKQGDAVKLSWPVTIEPLCESDKNVIWPPSRCSEAFREDLRDPSQRSPWLTLYCKLRMEHPPAERPACASAACCWASPSLNARPPPGQDKDTRCEEVAHEHEREHLRGQSQELAREVHHPVKQEHSQNASVRAVVDPDNQQGLQDYGGQPPPQLRAEGRVRVVSREPDERRVPDRPGSSIDQAGNCRVEALLQFIKPIPTTAPISTQGSEAQ